MSIRDRIDFVMIVTEAMLAPYRLENGKALVRYSQPRASATLRARPPPPVLPQTFFTPTTDIFESSWRDPTVRSRNPKECLQVVPVLAFPRTVPVLKPGREWLAIVHQCGGHSCERVEMIATRLKPRASILPALNAIAREGYYAQAGHFDKGQILASRIAAYVGALSRLGLDCEWTWRHLTESLYPIDATPENLDRIAEEVPDLEKIVAWQGAKPVRYNDEIIIFLIAENSD